MKFIKKLILFLLIFLFISKVNAFDFEVKSDKAIMINTSDNIILYEKNADVKTSIASLTKIVTAITVLDNVENINKEININWEMLNGLDGYAKAGFNVGDSATVEELLYAMMLPSGADAAQALAISTSGNINDFVNLMNQEVIKIGAINSHFSNPVGIDNSDNYSTARDLSIILEYSLENEVFKRIYESNNYYVRALNKNVQKTIKNTADEYNLDISFIKGSKTGWTTDAGMCLSSTATVDDVNYLLIVLNAKELTLDHITDTINLYNYYKNNYGHKTIIEENDLLYTLKVKDSKQKKYEIRSLENVTLYLNNTISKDNIKIIYDGIDPIERGYKKGDFLGKISAFYEDELLYSTDIYLNEDIKFYNYELYITVASIIILAIIFLIIFKITKKKTLN